MKYDNFVLTWLGVYLGAGCFGGYTQGYNIKVTYLCLRTVLKVELIMTVNLKKDKENCINVQRSFYFFTSNG